MPKLEKCAIQVFGSDFNVEAFHHELSFNNSRVIAVRNNLSIPNHYTEAYRIGNVRRWTCESELYIENQDNSYEKEEAFMISFLNKFSNFSEQLKPYKNNTTEVWFFALYTMIEGERPSGFFYSNSFFEKLNNLDCAFSTDVRFI